MLLTDEEIEARELKLLGYEIRKGVLCENFWDGTKEGECRYEVNGKCAYPNIIERRGYCWSSAKCNFRPVFPSARNYIYDGDYSRRNRGGYHHGGGR